ncbi:hypothetical protein HPB52_025002 [Rhipicephalus sanguineus]|uniref:Uncharacterized protein n=1 Tax=Rhipicephalus sanguineus TaxID=34632 RepID=A0A9D4TDL2_RHISA|nr:hypothetical protein HPB52_025002 [Rhipicephalus sanguineus]
MCGGNDALDARAVTAALTHIVKEKALPSKDMGIRDETLKKRRCLFRKTLLRNLKLCENLLANHRTLRQEPEAHVQQQEHEIPNVLPEVEASGCSSRPTPKFNVCAVTSVTRQNVEQVNVLQ